MILMPPPSEYWDYRNMAPCLACEYNFDEGRIQRYFLTTKREVVIFQWTEPVDTILIK
jgi:hypothetical protein